jgi:hypothetical protein
MKIKPAGMEALKTMASGNLEAALLAAVRLGATRSMEAAKPIKRAAEMLDYEAECLKECHAPDGNWQGEAPAKKDYDEFKQIAKDLRGLLG